ncbi:MAG TPA: hypothetical protein PK129_12790, partial [Cellvibrionaceae bacterium]|nr:hypothetical protein [Cellvibrionaceae bacterium]
MKLKLGILGCVTCATLMLVACEAPRSGQYLGGMVVVDLNDNDSARAVARQKSKQRTDVVQ